MAKSIFYPSESPLMVSSFKHMDAQGKLSVVHHNTFDSKGLQIGFTEEEMANRIEFLLKGIGLVHDFSSLVYLVGHGASSINNTYYAGYDCGACCGRAGSVNARVAAQMANNEKVRKRLAEKGILIPTTTKFVAALHDTTRDEILFYEEAQLTPIQKILHKKNALVFEKALQKNAKERARRFLTIDTTKDAKTIHNKVRLRSLSLFEPRPEWNHASNALCIVANRSVIQQLFLDRRAFLNSYDHSIDPNGELLLGILQAVAPVCGGINLEYYFSRIDNERLGAGTKLSHNVMGLIGVVNGMDGDLRTGLPKQMINIHDPIRLMVIVVHHAHIVLQTIQQYKATYEWFFNEWIHLVVMDPKSKALFHFKEGKMIPYAPSIHSIPQGKHLEKMLEQSHDNLPISLLR